MHFEGVDLGCGLRMVGIRVGMKLNYEVLKPNRCIVAGLF